MKFKKFRSPMVSASDRVDRSQERGLFSLALPIFLEFLMINIVANVDILMVGRVSEAAVGALGSIRQLLLIQNVVFSFICIGTTILISQQLGAGRRQDVEEVARAAVLMNIIVAMVLGGIYMVFYYRILILMKLPDELIDIIRNYFRLVGGICIFQGMTLTFSAIMKAHGDTKDVFYINLGVHLLNIIGNSIFIFGHFGVPILGVTGVGISTVFARMMGFVGAYTIITRRYDFHLGLKRTGREVWEKMRRIFVIGFPIGGQQFCWNTAQVIILSFVNTMGRDTIEARTYLMLVTSFIITFSLGLGQGTALQVGRMIGAGRKEMVYTRCLKSTLLAFFIAIGVTSLVIYNKGGIMSVFNPDEETLRIAHQVFIWFLFLESGRVFNIVIVGSLHAAGDIRFPSLVGVVSPLVVAVSLAWILGIFFNLGLIGIWMANGIEEWCRGMVMLLRWRSRRWQNKKIV